MAFSEVAVTETNELPDAEPGRRGVVAVIQRDDGCLLVIRRSQHVAAPGKLCFPGGGIEADEDEPTALRRELQEELRIQIEAGSYLWRSFTSWGVDLAFWSAEIISGQTINPDPAEVEAVMWLSLDEMTAHADLLESNREFLDVLRGMQPSVEDEESPDESAD